MEQNIDLNALLVRRAREQRQRDSEDESLFARLIQLQTENETLKATILGMTKAPPEVS